MTKAIALMALVVGLASIPRSTPAAEPRCARGMHREEARLERCRGACDRTTTARTSFDPETCHRICDVRHDRALAKLERVRGCRVDAGEPSPEISYGGEIIVPNQITNPQGLCLDVRNGDSTNRTTIQTYHCNGTDAQNWYVHPNSISGLAGKCMDMPYSTDGGGVWLFDCWGGWNQQWTLTKASIGNRLTYTGGGLNVYGSGNGAAVMVGDGYSPNNWTYTASGELRLPDGRCLQPGWAGAMAATCNGSTQQKWTLGPRPAGIRWNANPGYCLATVEPNYYPGGYRSAVTIAPCNGGDSHQRWTVSSEIRNVTGKCLTFPDGAQDWTPVYEKLCYPYSNAYGPVNEYHQNWRISF